MEWDVIILCYIVMKQYIEFHYTHTPDCERSDRKRDIIGTAKKNEKRTNANIITCTLP